MAWLDCWLTIPWMLYDALAVRVLGGAALAMLLIAYSPHRAARSRPTPMPARTGPFTPE